MSPHASVVSDDLKACIPALHHQGYSVQNICNILALRKSLVYKTLAIFSKCGVINNPHQSSCISSHPHILSQADCYFLQNLIDHRHTLYLDELQQELSTK
ncbi:hypothetical protein PAXRUDRAFT_177577 [Paxillus rubicundulus Ve08.2h10]|uniref:Paired domain-containing protein n=1 Tax=Paxillus rubicundulus Ve08.2h10 TaxID=930991 RepID=A0A0D0CDW6_9AGAM|nr:hypothetical protein PAXRUDRAFT_177577 [Paxillus rubicundulus Ve08.2h10]